MHRKLIMGALALALPIGTIASLNAPAFAKKPPPNPISCTGFGAIVTFGNPISKSGVATSAKKANNTSIGASSFNCGGGTGNAHNSAITITGGKNTKLAKTDPRYNKTTGVKYVTGTQAAFEASGGSLKKTLKQVSFVINGQSVLFKTKGASEVIGGTTCPGAVGFVISGQVKSGTYLTKTASITACLNHDTGPGTTNSFGVDLFSNTAVIDTAILDATSSKATL